MYLITFLSFLKKKQLPIQSQNHVSSIKNINLSKPYLWQIYFENFEEWYILLKNFQDKDDVNMACLEKI